MVLHSTSSLGTSLHPVVPPGRKGQSYLPRLVSTTETAWTRRGALDSEYSTKTSSSFRAVFTTRRNWAEDESIKCHRTADTTSNTCKPHAASTAAPVLAKASHSSPLLFDSFLRPSLQKAAVGLIPSVQVRGTEAVSCQPRIMQL